MEFSSNPSDSASSTSSSSNLNSNSSTIGPKLAPYNPTNLECVQLALNLLNVTTNDILYDLGSFFPLPSLDFLSLMF